MANLDNLFLIQSLVAPCYSEPNFMSSKLTEAVSGETVKIIEEKKDWLFIEQSDGYKSWIKEFYGTNKNKSFFPEYLSVEVLPIPFGTRLKYMDGNYFTVQGDLYNYKMKPVKLGNKLGAVSIINYAKRLIGCPYRWGGKTSLGFDCSGFVQSVYLAAGILLPRDSWQQSDFLKDKHIEGDLSKPGDLHFFGKNGKISHVGISTGGFGIIHCQGWVKEERFSPDQDIYHNTVLEDMYMHTCSLELNLNT